MEHVGIVQSSNRVDDLLDPRVVRDVADPYAVIKARYAPDATRNQRGRTDGTTRESKAAESRSSTPSMP